MEPLPAEESRVLPGCLGGYALAHQHLEGLTAFPHCGSGNKNQHVFSKKKNQKNQSKINPLPPSIWAHSAGGQVMLVMTLHKLPRTDLSGGAPRVPVAL